MKKKSIARLLACALSAGMVFSMAGCGGEPADSGSVSSTPDSASGSDAASGEGSSQEETGSSQEEAQDSAAASGTEDDENLPSLKLSISVASDVDHNAAPSEEWKRLNAEIEELSNTELTWIFDGGALELLLASNDLPDIGVYGVDAIYSRACKEGYFWDLTDYIKDYPNLNAIEEMTYQNASVEGRFYGLPRIRALARNGFAYRKDWLDNLGLAEPKTIDDVYNMWYAFTYNDPDGNGVDDTVGYYTISYPDMWDQIQCWFGAPNKWGIDENGDLIPTQLTSEYKEALVWIRECYSMGLINKDFKEVDWATGTRDGVRTNKGGSANDTLDNLRKIQTYFDDEGIDAEVMLGGIDVKGEGKYILPTSGYNRVISISRKNIQTEEDLRRVLKFLNQCMDPEIRNLIDFGWEGLTYYMGDDGYAVRYTDDEKAANGISEMKYANGANQILTYSYANEDDPAYLQVAPATAPINLLEAKLAEENVQYCIPNYGAGFSSETYNSVGGQLDEIITEGRWDYITGEIDDAGLEEVLNTWLGAGMQTVIDEMNAAYHAAGN